MMYEVKILYIEIKFYVSFMHRWVQLGMLMVSTHAVCHYLYMIY